MENKNLPKTQIAYLILFLIIAFALVLTLREKGIKDENLEDNKNIVEETQTGILSNEDDLVFLSILPGGVLKGEMEIIGEVKGGYFFEANILVNILDENKNVLKQGYGTATTDWMTTDPVSFKSDIDLTGLPAGDGYLELLQDDPSDGEGGPAKRILIPIVIE